MGTAKQQMGYHSSSLNYFQANINESYKDGQIYFCLIWVTKRICPSKTYIIVQL